MMNTGLGLFLLPGGTPQRVILPLAELARSAAPKVQAFGDAGCPALGSFGDVVKALRWMT